ncbi:hypothetical protein [Thalassobius sp. Cn5-15]|uniref:hypothetical protein n=1 Tax=Thalassobius sp. Cn5-15 TaxID=2917763 RepID=UPI001EF23E28|nr:hypothetical protein [Thalassobius sp. Cn5-15]MCG7493058.1 hypothetical protein [Thalassobius sp. Cn5-15]
MDKIYEPTANRLISNYNLDLNGDQGRNRTTDTRIFNPELILHLQPVSSRQAVKSATKHQRFSRCLSNLSIRQSSQRKTAEGAATHLNGIANLSAHTAYQKDDLTAIAGGAHAQAQSF